MIEHYKNIYKKFGLPSVLIEVVNSIAHKIGFKNIERIYILDEIEDGSKINLSIVINELSEGELRLLKDAKTYSFSEQDIARVPQGIAICLAAYLDGQLVGIYWYALKPYPHSPGKYAYFTEDRICGYGAWIDPAARGKNIRGAFVSRGLEKAKAIGRKGIIEAIDWNNIGSIKSGLSLGYKYRGLSFWSKLISSSQKKEYFLN